MQSTAKKLCSQAFNFGILIHTTYAAYSPKALSSLLLVDAYSQSICSLQPQNSVKPFTCGCLFTQHICSLQPRSSVKPFTCGCLFTQPKHMHLFTKHMQPTAQKLSQAFYMWVLIHKAYAAYSPKAQPSLLLVDAYSQSQSMCSLQPKSSSVKPFV